MPNPLNHGEQFAKLKETKTQDGMGGYITDYRETDKFTALVTLDSSMLARQMEQSGVKDIYTAYVDKGCDIKQYDYFKRLSDNEVFMVTSNPSDKATPKISNMNFKVFSTKKTTLPK